MTTLTDRYVDATLRRLPGRQRADIERELRTSIADAVEDRIDAGHDPAEAEVAALTALGDPARLAAGYADRPLQLIGPALFHDYTQLLAALLASVVPLTAAVVGLVGALRGDQLLTLAGDALGAAFTAGVHVVCWTTLVFAVLERTAARRGATARCWTPDALPQQPSRRARYAELVTEVVVTVLFSSFVLLSPRLAFQRDADGDPIGLLSPWLWQTGFVYAFLALIAVSLGFAFVKHYARWSVPLAVTGALLDVAAALAMVWLVTNDRLLNPAFATAAQWTPGTSRWIGAGVLTVAIGTLLFTVLEELGRARRR